MEICGPPSFRPQLAGVRLTFTNSSEMHALLRNSRDKNPDKAPRSEALLVSNCAPDFYRKIKIKFSEAFWGKSTAEGAMGQRIDAKALTRIPCQHFRKKAKGAEKAELSEQAPMSIVATP